LFRKSSVSKVFIAGALMTSMWLGLSGLVIGTFELFALRFLAGLGSALVFVGGGVLSAQLGSLHPKKSGLLLGIYYGGTGLGIVLSSLVVPLTVFWGQEQGMVHIWQPGWWLLAFVGLFLAMLMAKPSMAVPVAPPRLGAKESTAISSYAAVIFGYCCFGMGYIGYMTFVIALLKQMGIQGYLLNIFYAVLGLCVMASSRIWAPMLDRFKEGQSLGILNSLLALASFIPAFIALNLQDGQVLSQVSMVAIYFSGIIFGGCFLSAVASTTAYVKHNLPQSQWVSGITVFTTIFAIGQVLGPTLVGWISDGSGGLARGLLLSGCILLLGGAVASRQKPLQSVL
jgi:MFS family permease